MRVLLAACAYMRGEQGKYPNLQNKEEIGREPYRVLPEDDPFIVGSDYFIKSQEQDTRE